MRAQFVNEKFTEEESDPIKDLGIGEPAYAVLTKIPEQAKHDKSQFFVELSNGDYVVAMGDEFNSEEFGISLKEMLILINKGIEKFLNSKKRKFTYEDLGAYSDFFQTEFNDDNVEFLTREYVVAKLHCGKENAKQF
jgi:hypothetical protein